MRGRLISFTRFNLRFENSSKTAIKEPGTNLCKLNEIEVLA